MMNLKKLSLMTLSILCMTGCKQQVNVLSNQYTKGIGIYPGEPEQNFAPTLLPDNDNYRNIALHRTVYQSSAFDYNLTGQLVTDTEITQREPKSFIVTQSGNELSLLDYEKAADGNPYTCIRVMGEEGYFQYQLLNYQQQPDQIVLHSNAHYWSEHATEGFCIEVLASNNGTNWDSIGKYTATKAPDKKIVGPRIPASSNWDREPMGITIRMFDEPIALKCEQPYSYFRVQFNMKGASEWRISEAEFFQQKQLLDMKAAQFYTSAWKSATSANEWITIDLGSHSTFDQVKLYWINKATSGQILVSDDNKNWKEIAQLPADEEATNTITCKGKGRYVKIAMNQTANNEPFVLSEVEIMGKGGLIAVPAQQPQLRDGKLFLSGGNWKLQRASLVNKSGEQISTSEFDASQWLTATVPGTVLTSYIVLGAIPEPNYADNIRTISESFFYSNFWYRNEFTLPEDFNKEVTTLHFDGINWKANVFVNGVKAGRIEGAFMRGEFDITQLLQSGTNIIAVEIIKNDSFGTIREKTTENTGFNGGVLGADNPTFHASIGWDWITTVRGRNMGIWSNVYLSHTGSVTLADPYIKSVIELPDTTATLTPEVMLTNHSTEVVKGVLKGRIANITFEQEVELQGNETKGVQFCPEEYNQLANQHLALWWPNGYGQPTLHAANFTFIIGDEVSDSKDFNCGIRQMVADESDGVLKLYINGRRFIGRGGNWGFSEHNLRYRAREYDTAVKYHADMHFTMIRNWVGMIGEDAFYDACDKYGIVVWQDFWLANPSDGPDPNDNDLFLRNAENTILRIRNHASVGLYCGRNEGFPPAILDDGLRQLINKYHADLHYIPSSADGVVSGRGPYAVQPNKVYYTLFGNEKFHSERGLPNIMNIESLKRTLTPEGLWPQGDEWGKHDFTQRGAQKGSTLNELMEKHFGSIPDNAERYSQLAQVINYEGYRAVFESRSLNRKGLLLWMSHPCWPSQVWQTYDYYFDPTAGFFGCMKANEPLHIQYNPLNNTVEVVNYSAGIHNDLLVKVDVYDLNGQIIASQQTDVNSEEDTTIKCFELDLQNKLQTNQVVLLRLTLRENESIVSENTYIYGEQEDNYEALMQMPVTQISQQMEIINDEKEEVKVKVTLTNKGKIPALFVRLNLIGEKDGDQILPVHYSDNYLTMMPNESKEIIVSWLKKDTRGNQPKFNITGVNL